MSASAHAACAMPPGYQWFDEVRPDEAEEYLVPSLIPMRGFVPMNGKRGTGKTFVALELVRCGAAGEPFLGRPTERFGSIYCVGEKMARFGNRLEALRLAFRDAPEPPPVVRWSVPNLLDDASVAAFISEVHAVGEEYAKLGVPLGLIVFDTLARTLRHANVSDADAAGSAIENIQCIIEKCGVTVMPLAHVAKAEGSTSIKGAGEWEDAADAVLTLDRNGEEPVRTLNIAKESDGPDGGRLGFSLEVIELGTTASGRRRTSCVVRHVELTSERAGVKRLKGPALIAAEALQFLVDQGVTHQPPPLPGVPAHWRAVKMSDWRDRAFTTGLVVEGDTAGNQRTKWSRAIAAAKEAKLVRIEGEWAIPLQALQRASRPGP